MYFRRQPKHHRDPPVARKSAGEHAPAKAVCFVVILDVVEQKCWAWAGALREPGNGAQFDVPVDLSVDLMQFMRGVECLYPAAQIAKGDRFRLGCHSMSSTPRQNRSRA